MADYKINKVRAQALQSGFLGNTSPESEEKLKKLKPFAEVSGRPNSQYLNKKQRGYGVK